jgi:uncharacterized membrane protein YhiD involved in acid resistance
MNEFIIENFGTQQALSIYTILLNNLVVIVIGLFIMFTYKITYSGTAYSHKFNISIGMITIVTTMIMSVIGNNIALSLGMVGALSIIRFRTAVKDVRDATFIFWSIAVGIGCGVSQYLLVAIGSATIFLFLLIFKQVAPTSQHLLIIRGKIEEQNKIEGIVVSYFNTSAKLSMKNATADTCEFVYKISEGALNKAKDKNKIDVIEKLQRLEGVINVNLVEQTDDISR